MFKKLDPTWVSKTVWSASIVMSFYFLASSLAFGFVLPIFLRSRGFGYWEIGIVLAAYNGLGTLLLLFAAQRVLTLKNAIIVQTLSYFPAAVVIPLSEGWLMIAMIVMMAFAEWTSCMTMENVVVDAVRRCENTATAISFLFTPPQLASMVGLLFASLLVERYGYTVPFWAAGTLFAAYSTSAWLMFKDEEARR